MRKSFKLAALAPFMALLMLVANTTPASAAAAGGGAVTGNVTIRPGVNATPTNTTYLFLGFVIAGAIVAVPPPLVCVGLFTTLLVGGATVGETTSGGSGTVAGRFTGPLARCSGSFLGVFERVGPVVVVVLNAVLAGGCCAATLTVEAVFVPNRPLQAGRTVTTATFAGLFQVQSTAGLA